MVSSFFNSAERSRKWKRKMTQANKFLQSQGVMPPWLQGINSFREETSCHWSGTTWGTKHVNIHGESGELSMEPEATVYSDGFQTCTGIWSQHQMLWFHGEAGGSGIRTAHSFLGNADPACLGATPLRTSVLREILRA